MNIKSILEAITKTAVNFINISEIKTICWVKSKFKDKELTEVGGKLTFYYFIFILVIFGWRLPALFVKDLNEVGDFLAGVFGPVAFLWLVVGYLMQNKELRANNTATEETQSLARDQLEFQQLQQTRILDEKLRLAQPDLVVDNVNFVCPYDANSDAYSIQIKNHGASISSFQLFDEQGKYLSSSHRLPHGEEVNIDIYEKPEIPTTKKAGIHDLETYNITYFDSLKIMQKATMKLILEKIDGDKVEPKKSRYPIMVYSAYIKRDKKLNKE